MKMNGHKGYSKWKKQVMKDNYYDISIKQVFQNSLTHGSDGIMEHRRFSSLSGFSEHNK